MPITQLPTPPQRSDPANFAVRADAFFAALPTFVTQFNAMVPTTTASSVIGAFAVSGTVNFGGGAVITDGAGNVGIGASAPQAKVEAVGNIRASHGTNATFRGLEFGIPGSAQVYGSVAMEVNNGELRSTAGYTGWGGFQTWYTNGTEKMRLEPAGHLTPGADNTQTCGSSIKRWSTIFAGTGAINTSDARQKTEISPLTPAELAAASELAASVGAYEFLAAIAAKGDAARTHTGMTVQHAISVMQSHGLVPMQYAFICYDAWSDEFVDHIEVESAAAVIDQHGVVIVPAIAHRAAWREQTRVAGDSFGFRMDELLAFIVRGQEARLESLSARLTALEQAP